MIEQFPALQKLSPREKLILANELTDQFQESDDRESKAAMMELFEERWEHYKKNPESAIPWNEFKDKLGFAN